MTWFRLDDQGAFHAKVIAVGNEAYGAWCRAGQWSSDHLTDGRIPTAIAHVIASRRVWKRLVTTIPVGHTVGLAVEREDGYELHDYLVYNPSAADVRADRAARSEIKQAAGRKGGLAKAAKQAASRPPSKPPSSGLAETLAEPKQNVAPVPVPVPVPLPIPERSGISVSDGSPESAERGVPRSEWAMHQAIYVAAYELAVRTASGNPRWTMRRTGDLQLVLASCCLGAERGDIEGWIAARVRELVAFIASVPDGERRFWADPDAGAMLRWFNRNRPATDTLSPAPKRQPLPPYQREYIDPYEAAEASPRPAGGTR